MTDLTETAVVTGSTLGSGLGLARGLAEAGANVVLNGFGDAADIERTRAELDAGPEQLAGVALFLCSDAAENITGIALPVDGGWTAA